MVVEAAHYCRDGAWSGRCMGGSGAAPSIEILRQWRNSARACGQGPCGADMPPGDRRTTTQHRGRSNPRHRGPDGMPAAPRGGLRWSLPVMQHGWTAGCGTAPAPELDRALVARASDDALKAFD